MNDILGGRIRVLRESLNLTQENMADKLNMSRQRYARIEKGINDISYDFILKVSEVLGVDPGEITSVSRNFAPSVTEFRNLSGAQPTFDTVSEILDLFYANKKLYDKVKRGDE